MKVVMMMATDRWKVFQIVNNQLEEIEVDKYGSTNLTKNDNSTKKKMFKRYDYESSDDD